VIQSHFDLIEAAIRSCSVVASYEIARFFPSPTTGYLRGKATFVNHSVLHFFEFCRLTPGLEKDKYRYQYSDVDGKIVFRYDNAPHHRPIVTFPHHKHLKEEKVIDSFAPTLEQVLNEITDTVLSEAM
jgi:hypothetical protein